MKKLLVLALGVALFPAPAVAEDPTEAPKEDSKENKEDAEKAPEKITPGGIEPGEPATAIEDSSSARRQVARFQKEWKEAKSNQDRLKALERLGKWDHGEVLKAAQRHTKHKDHNIATAAVVVCARQLSVKKKAAKAVLGVLRREKRTNVVCAAMLGLGWLGCDKKAAVKEAKKLFRKDWRELHKAATRYFGYIKYKPVFRLLAEQLDEPRPANPNDPNNPPASYWKERWHAWNKNVKWTRWALAQMVPGETFDEKSEAKAWAETEGKKHGIEW